MERACQQSENAADDLGQEGVRCVAKNKITERKQDESISIQRLQRPAAVPQRGAGGKGVGRVALQRLRVDARNGFPSVKGRQQDGST